MMQNTAKTYITEWRSQTEAQTLFSANEVQSRLFDLWGELGDEPVRAEVEKWLTLTVQRELFSDREIREFLDGLDGELSSAGA
jgi:hypothetical protein